MTISNRIKITPTDIEICRGYYLLSAHQICLFVGACIARPRTTNGRPYSVSDDFSDNFARPWCTDVFHI